MQFNCLINSRQIPQNYTEQNCKTAGGEGNWGIITKAFQLIQLLKCHILHPKGPFIKKAKPGGTSNTVTASCKPVTSLLADCGGPERPVMHGLTQTFQTQLVQGGTMQSDATAATQTFATKSKAKIFGSLQSDLQH